MFQPLVGDGQKPRSCWKLRSEGQARWTVTGECGVLWSLTGVGGGWDRAEVSRAKLDTSWGDAEICGVLTLS